MVSMWYGMVQIVNMVIKKTKKDIQGLVLILDFGMTYEKLFKT